jgi:hypothetical protein
MGADYDERKGCKSYDTSTDPALLESFSVAGSLAEGQGNETNESKALGMTIELKGKEPGIVIEAANLR